MLKEFIDGYINCLAWCGMLEIGYNPETMEGEHTTIFEEFGDDYCLDSELIAQIEKDCNEFYKCNKNKLDCMIGKNYDWQCAGHDFYLTRNRHGAGFWDRGMGIVGDKLTKRAHEEGEFDFFYIENGIVKKN